MRGANMKFRLIAIVGLMILSLAVSVGAQRTKKSGGGAKSIHIDLSKEKAGGESGKFLSVVGNWSIVQDGDKKVLAVDGREWMRGQPAGGLAEKARAIYGSRQIGRASCRERV